MGARSIIVENIPNFVKICQLRFWVAACSSFICWNVRVGREGEEGGGAEDPRARSGM